MRFSYGLLYVPLWIAALMQLVRASSGTTTIYRRHLRSFTTHLAVPAAVAIGVLLLAQWWKFGSPLDHGYHQWRQTKSALSSPVTNAPGPIEQAVRTGWLYIGKPGNGNVFIHYPLFGIALLAWPSFWKRHRAESSFIAACIICIAAPVITWKTEGYGYGPRYLIPALVLLGLPVLEMGRIFCARRRVLTIGGGLTAAVVLAWSFQMQLYMNALPSFAYYYVAEHFTPAAEGTAYESAMKEYLSPIHRGYIHRDLLRHRRGAAQLPAMTIAVQAVPASRQGEAREVMETYIHSISPPNWQLIGFVRALHTSRDRAQAQTVAK